MGKVTILATDGACKNPGKLNCLSVGTCLNINFDDLTVNEVSHICEPTASSSQRGEINGFLLGLRAAKKALAQGTTFVFLLSDSEYVVNCVTKRWFNKWNNNDWMKADGERVKHRDLWQEVHDSADVLDSIAVLHIKGHLIPFGKVTAEMLLEQDPTASLLLQEVMQKVIKEEPMRAERFSKARALFKQNNGAATTEDNFLAMAAANVTVDLLATGHVKEQSGR